MGHDLTGMDERVMGFEDEKPGAGVAVLTPLGSEVGAFHEGQVPARAGFDFDRDPDFDFDFDTDSGNDRTNRQPLPGGDA